MTGREKYNAVYEALSEKIESGELTVENAEAINAAAYKRYVEDNTSKACDTSNVDQLVIEACSAGIISEKDMDVFLTIIR